MAATQVPKGFGLLFVLVGVPLILWSASGANEQLAALDSTEAREKQCMATTVKMTPIPRDEARPMCKCIVREAKERGIVERHGSYDKEALKPVLDLCIEANVQQ